VTVLRFFFLRLFLRQGNNLRSKKAILLEETIY